MFDENGSPTLSEYFIGSIVAYKDGDVFQLIDGQQRITTLFIALCAFRDRRKDLSDSAPLHFLESMIHDQYQNMDGTTGVRLRLKPLYEDAGQVLQEMAQQKPVMIAKGLPNSARNMLDAYSTAYEFLEEQFGDDVVKLRTFQAHLAKRVRLVRIQTGNVSDALRIFETINDRGIGLDALDLLKNLLFRQAERTQFNQLTEIWKEMVHTIEKTRKGEKPLRFLRYFVLSRYPDARKNGKPVTEDDLYDWLSTKRDEIGISKNPIAFAKTLLDAARAYSGFVSKPGRALSHIYRYSARARQHLIVMLATGGLTQQEQEEVEAQLEKLFVAFVLTREPTKALDLIFANAAPALHEFIRATPSSPQRMGALRQHLETWVRPEITKRMPRIESALDLLTLERKTTVRFVLCRIAQYLEKIASCPVAEIDHYWSYHIEHILPNQPTKELRADFDKAAEYDMYKQRIGNLTLLEQPINSAIGRAFFQEKQPHYQKSALFMTRSLMQSQSVGENSAFTKAAQYLPVFTQWGSASIESRQGHLKHLALQTWGFDAYAKTS